jgi:hypothetical protein
MSALDSSISWFTMQTIYGNWREENIFFHQRRGWLLHHQHKYYCTPPTQILLCQLLCHQHRYYSAANRDITPPATFTVYYYVNFSGSKTDPTVHRHQQRPRTLPTTQILYYIATYTDTTLPSHRYLPCQQHRF